MRAQDAHRKAAIRMVLTSIQLAEVELGHVPTDPEIVALIRKEVKRREEAVEMMREAGRDEMVAEEETELEILGSYLPALMSEAEIRELASSVIDEVGASSPRDMGRVMGAIMPQVKGRADGRMVNQVVRDLLSA
jgi:uncharacterized protein